MNTNCLDCPLKGKLNVEVFIEVRFQQKKRRRESQRWAEAFDLKYFFSRYHTVNKETC